jgi:6,7-dimethyl-8-ribityllumazine synthase
MHQTHATTDLPKIPGARIAILQSKWYREYTDLMTRKCLAVLAQAGCDTVDVHILPGSVEMPLAARRLARKTTYDAIICLSIIMKGDTFHFEMITTETMRGLGQVMLEDDVPVIVEILPVTSMEQVVARCSDDDNNKGIEAALAAIEIITWQKNNL